MNQETNNNIVEPNINPIQVNPVNNIQPEQQVINIQQQMQTIPTVEQDKQEFINNTQTENTEKKEKKKEGSGIIFIIILFAIIFAAIFFLFPYLLKLIG